MKEEAPFASFLWSVVSGLEAVWSPTSRGSGLLPLLVVWAGGGRLVVGGGGVGGVGGGGGGRDDLGGGASLLIRGAVWRGG